MADREQRRVIRLFLASPNDVIEEREAVRYVVEEFNNHLGRTLSPHYPDKSDISCGDNMVLL